MLMFANRLETSEKLKILTESFRCSQNQGVWFGHFMERGKSECVSLESLRHSLAFGSEVLH